MEQRPRIDPPTTLHLQSTQSTLRPRYVAKQNLKRRAAETDLPTKYLAAEAVSGIGFEARSKLGCQISGLARMARIQQHAVLLLLREPPEPRAAKWVRYDQQLQRNRDSYDYYSDKMNYLRAIGNRAIL